MPLTLDSGGFPYGVGVNWTSTITHTPLPTFRTGAIAAATRPDSVWCMPAEIVAASCGVPIFAYSRATSST
ncbi:hypothetical protein GKE82_25060 [Conexibacter sp. W3-3-2]|uniref:hypothetical protein n=1 Tax=Conexibacter sp. W3-3-2 TaxID=2675227 RepID=UPI0012B96AAE|nr:hypothetical protein [Conexibacter sp. W3-3-2]MTD47476.1 hypothetical protein [Conexibacter sp. W3-3-2]